MHMHFLFSFSKSKLIQVKFLSGVGDLLVFDTCKRLKVLRNLQARNPVRKLTSRRKRSFHFNKSFFLHDDSGLQHHFWLVRLWSNWNSHILLIGVGNGEVKDGLFYLT